MLVNEEFDNSKSNLGKMQLTSYYSPYIHKKKSIGNLYTEPRKIPIEKDSNSRNKAKQKINYSIKIANSNIKSQQDSLTKSLKLTSEKNNKKGRNMHQSYVKLNTKLYLKKNAIPNLASFHELNSNYPPTPLMKNSTTNIIMSNSIKRNDNNNNLSVGKNRNKNMNNNKNIKLIYGNNISNNNLSKNFNYNYNTYSNNNLLKKTAGSANELFRNNFSKKIKNKNTAELNNINNLNQIGYIFTTSGNNNPPNKAFLSPQSTPGQKIIFLKNDKNKLKESKEKSRKSSTNSSNKDLKKNSLSKKKAKKVNVENLKLNLDEQQNKSVQYLLRNTYNNVKIYPTTVLNNKIIYQDNKKMSHSVNNSANSSIHHSSSKKKNDLPKKRICININNKRINNKNNEFNTVEEVHYLLVKTIQNSRNMIINMDKKE